MWLTRQTNCFIGSITKIYLYKNKMASKSSCAAIMTKHWHVFDETRRLEKGNNAIFHDKKTLLNYYSKTWKLKSLTSAIFLWRSIRKSKRFYVIDTCGYRVSKAYIFLYNQYPSDLLDCWTFSSNLLDRRDLWKPGGGGTAHMKGVGMLAGNFELNP